MSDKKSWDCWWILNPISQKIVVMFFTSRKYVYWIEDEKMKYLYKKKVRFLDLDQENVEKHNYL
jgi:hypothetical protein